MADFKILFTRRNFLATSLLTVAATSVHGLSVPIQSELTVQQLIDLILREIPGTIPNTVDTLKIGNPNQKITGVVTTMFPTIAVIKQAIRLNANFIIAHEPSFYNHADETGWLENDEVFKYKKTLLEENKIAIWRFHDYLHRHDPDGVLEGVVGKLGWKKYQDRLKPTLFTLDHKQPLANIISHAKKSLEISNVRFVGDGKDLCQRVLILPGAWGGRNQISQLIETKPDLLIVGEVAEWETSEHIRDARLMGLNRSLLVLGHAQSEEPGLEWLVKWINEKAHNIRVTHVPSENPFTFA